MLRVLVATELPDASVLPIDALGDCAPAPFDEVVLLHVLDLGTPHVGQAADELHDLFEERLVREAARLRGRGFPVKYRVEEGAPANVIVTVAQQMRADLIIVGSVGRRLGSGRRVGRTAERVAVSIPTPVLVDVVQKRDGEWYRLGVGPPFERVLVAVDLDDTAARAFAAAQRLPGVSHIEIAHVLANDDDRRAASAFLEEMVAAYEGEIAVETRILEGDVAEALTDAAASSDATLVLTPRRERARTLLLFGSVARAVMRKTSLPVIFL